MSSTEIARAEPAAVDVGADVLRYLGLDPKSSETRALVLLCERYRLDPLLEHARIIATKNGFRPYITRDGMIEIAHRSGRLDGIVVDEERRSTTGDGWTAYVSVWRTDMSHPFRYGAQCKDTEPQARQGNGPEMALARAERRALRRAFSIPAYDDAPEAEHVETIDARVVDRDTGEKISNGNVTPPDEPGELEPDEAPPDEDEPPAYVTDEQRETMRPLMAAAGLDTPAKQLEFASSAIGRTLEAPGRLSFDEGEQLIAALRAKAGPR